MRFSKNISKKTEKPTWDKRTEVGVIIHETNKIKSKTQLISHLVLKDILLIIGLCTNTKTQGSWKDKFRMSIVNHDNGSKFKSKPRGNQLGIVSTMHGHWLDL